MTSFLRALKEVRRWGVTIREFEPPWKCPQQGAFQAPSTSGYIIRRSEQSTPIIFWRRGEEHASGLLHELCHCLVWIVTEKDPTAQREIDFVALEREMNRRCKTNWREWMEEYTTGLAGPNEEWNYAPTQVRHRLLEESTAEMERLGLMRKGKPTYEVRAGGS